MLGHLRFLQPWISRVSPSVLVDYKHLAQPLASSGGQSRSCHWSGITDRTKTKIFFAVNFFAIARNFFFSKFWHPVAAKSQKGFKHRGWLIWLNGCRLVRRRNSVTSSDPSFATCLNFLGQNFCFRFETLWRHRKRFFVSTCFVSTFFESTTSEDVEVVAGLGLRIPAQHLVDQTPDSNSGRLPARQRTATWNFFAKHFFYLFALGNNLPKKWS